MIDDRSKRKESAARMANASLKRKLGWLEGLLYAGGVASLAVFLVIRSEGERAAQAGIEAFEASLRAAAREQSAATVPAAAAPGIEEAPGLPAELPGEYRFDQGLWSEQRVRDYASGADAAAAPLALLTIDTLDLAVPVYDGTEEDVLSRGVGRVRGTARVDSEGNLGIAGHRDSFFRPLKDIREGDRIELRTAGGTVTYSVSSIVIVDPEDVSVLAPTSERTLTLVTCYPFYYVGHAPKRYIVKATAEHSLAKT